MRSAVATAPAVGTDKADGIGRRLQHAAANRIGAGTADRSGGGRIEAEIAIACDLLPAVAVIEQGNRNQRERHRGRAEQKRDPQKTHAGIGDPKTSLWPDRIPIVIEAHRTFPQQTFMRPKGQHSLNFSRQDKSSINDAVRSLKTRWIHKRSMRTG